MVVLLLGNADQSRTWLFRSYEPTVAAKNEMIDAVARSLIALKFDRRTLKAPRPPVVYGGSGSWQARLRSDKRVPAGLVHVDLRTPWHYRTSEEKRIFREGRLVKAERIMPALNALADTTVDAMRLWTTCADLGMPSAEPPQVSVGLTDYWPGSTRRYQTQALNLMSGSGFDIELPSDLGLPSAFNEVSQVRFEVGNVPTDITGDPLAMGGERRMYIAGDCAELGRWDLERAVPLHYQQEVNVWIRTMRILTSEHEVDYKYVRLSSGRQGPACWEAATTTIGAGTHIRNSGMTTGSDEHYAHGGTHPATSTSTSTSTSHGAAGGTTASGHPTAEPPVLACRAGPRVRAYRPQSHGGVDYREPWLRDSPAGDEVQDREGIRLHSPKDSEIMRLGEGRELDRATRS